MSSGLCSTHVRTRPNITLRFGWQVDGFAQDENGVTLDATRIGGGARETWRARYLVGCDGGRSFVRARWASATAAPTRSSRPSSAGAWSRSICARPTLYRDVLGDRRAWQYWVVNPELRTAIVAAQRHATNS